MKALAGSPEPSSGLNDVTLEVKVNIAYFVPFPGKVDVTFGGETVTRSPKPETRNPKP